LLSRNISFDESRKDDSSGAAVATFLPPLVFGNSIKEERAQLETMATSSREFLTEESVINGAAGNWFQ
jgi:hypothetical protein